MADKFYFVNNQTAESIKDLKEVITTLTYDQFMHHVSFDHNHFANWIEDVHKDKETAQKLRATVSKQEIISVLENKLNPAKKVVEENKSASKSTDKTQPNTTKSTTHKLKSVAEKIKPHITSQKQAKAEHADNSHSTHHKKSAAEEHTTHKNISHNAKKNLHTKKHLPNHPVSYVSSESPEKFILKEFLMGALFGLILGFVLMAMATNAGL